MGYYVDEWNMVFLWRTFSLLLCANWEHKHKVLLHLKIMAAFSLQRVRNLQHVSPKR